MRRFCGFVVGVAVLGCGLAGSTVQAQEMVRLQLSIRYLTREAVYLAAGSADGLRIGDPVSVIRDGRLLYKLEVKYLAEHSASCLLDSTSAGIRSDDKMIWTILRADFVKRTQPAQERAESKPVAAPAAPPAAARTVAPRSSMLSHRSTRYRAFSGQVSLQSLWQRDNGARQLDFVEPSAYVRLRAERLGGTPLRMELRLRSRQSYRNNPLSSQLRRQETINRVYELSLEYAPVDGVVEFSAGRILRNEIRGLGYLDGLAGAYRLGGGVKAGLFAGSQPELYRSSFQFQEKKLGGFVNYKNPLRGDGEFSTTLAAVGRYSRQQVSREYLALQSDLSLSRRLFVAQYIEMDINRRWRREMAGSGISFTDFFFNATYYWPRALSVYLAYDARRNVRTWETHDIADSLFDDLLRKGVHLGLNVQPLPSTRVSLDGGLRTAPNAENVYSGSVGITQSNILHSGVTFNGRMSYYGNSLSSGYYPSADVSWQLFRRLQGGVSAGAYIYSFGQPSRRQTNPWERLRLDVNLSRLLFLSGTLENYNGDTMKFFRGFVDVGVRF